MGARLEHAQVTALAAEQEASVRKIKAEMGRVVRKNVREGRTLARGFARKASGPHGSNYYKRITDEMTGPTRGEYGPTAGRGGEPVGAGYRHGGRNTDLPKSLDIQGPKFAADVGKLIDSWF